MALDRRPENRVRGGVDGLSVSATQFGEDKNGLDVNLLGGNVNIESATIEVVLDKNNDSVTSFPGDTFPIEGTVSVNNFPSSQNVVVTSSALPSGAATSALQTQPGVDIGDVTINNGSGGSAVNVQDGGNSITVDQPTGTNLHVVTDSGTITTVSTVTSLTQMNGAAISMGTGTRDSGTQRVTIATNDVVPVSDNGGTLTVDAAGQTASGASLTVNPVTTGGLAKTANPTAVSDGQVVNTLHDKLGKLVAVGSLRDLKANQQTTITSSTAETTIVTADATNFLDLYGLILTNTSATGSKVTIKDATSGTTRMVIWVPANDTRGFMLPESAAHKQASNNNNWTATCGTSVASIEITAMFVKNL